MTKKEIYKNYPLISTARDLNKERGLYLTIPYSFSDGKFKRCPSIRFTKSGYVLYLINGYHQPIYVKAGVRERRYHRLDNCYMDKIISFVEELLSGKAVLATARKGDFIKCTDCGIMALVPHGEDCPFCHKDGHNSWAVEGLCETDTATLIGMGYKIYYAE